MTSDRPYRKGLPLQTALEEIRRCAGSQFDPEVVEAFLAISPEALAQIRAHRAAPPAAAPVPLSA